MANINSLNKCPACKTVGEMVEENGLFVCQACGQAFSAATLNTASGAASSEVVAAQIKEAIHNIDSANTALVYVESFFEGYNWKNYNTSTDVYIEDLLIMVEKIKIKNADNAKAWMLDIASIVVPLQHKLDALATLQNKIADKYKGDVTVVAGDLASYNTVARVLVKEREVLVNKLNCAVANMSKFGASAEDVKNYKAQAENTIAELNALVVSGDVEDLPVVKKRLADNEKQQIAAYTAQGINALDNYKNGIAAYNVKRYSEAMMYLDPIKDFRDANKYIRLMNKVFEIADLVEAGGKRFISKDAAPGCSVMEKIKAKLKIGKKKDADAANAFDLFEIVDASLEKKASIKGYTIILESYGNYIYYIKGEKELCVYNTKDQTSTVLHKAQFSFYHRDEDGDLVITTGRSADGSKMYIEEAFSAGAYKGCAVKGCALNKKKYQKWLSERKNEKCLTVVNLRSGLIEPGIKEMKECLMDPTFKADRVIYTVNAENGTDKKGKATYGWQIRTFDVMTGEDKLLFDKPCYFREFVGSKLVYETWEYQKNNSCLWSYDVESGKHTLLENNAFEYHGAHEGRVFYTVGNRRFAALFSINLDGSERIEIMPKFSNGSIRSNGGWVYLLIGSGSYKRLVRISPDGSTKFIIATDVYRLHKIVGNYAYYFSARVTDSNASSDPDDRDFRVARLDGKTNLLVATDVNIHNVSIGTKYVYYTRNEYMDYETDSAAWSNNHWVKSLYRVDLDGHNVKKVLYNIRIAKDKDVNVDNTDIYSVKYVTKTFHITAEKEEFTETHRLMTYYSLNKDTGIETPIYYVDYPTEENYADLVKKKGCAKLFKKKGKVTIEEVPVDIDYGQLEVHSVEEDEAEDAAAVSNGADAAARAIGNGCKKGCNGCKDAVSKIFKKK